MDDFDKAYDVFSNSATTAGLKVVLTRSEGGEDW